MSGTQPQADRWRVAQLLPQPWAMVASGEARALVFWPLLAALRRRNFNYGGQKHEELYSIAKVALLVARRPCESHDAGAITARTRSSDILLLPGLPGIE